MRVLLLTTHFLPELTGNAPLLGELCEDLTARGHEVKVLAGPAQHNVGELGPQYRRWGLCRERLAGVPVVRVNGLRFRWNRWVERLFLLVWFPCAAFWVGLGVGKCEVILCPSPPLWLGLTARALAFLRRVPYVYVVQDLWPDAPILLGLVRQKPIVGVLRWIEQLVYRGARRIVAISDPMRRRLLELGVADEKIDEIPNWIDVDFFATPGTKAGSLRTALGVGEREVVVLYSGNMGRSHPVDLVVKAAALLRERKDLHYALVGAGAGLAPARELAEQEQLETVHFLPFQPRAQLPAALAGADIAVVPLLRGMGAFSLPSRMYMFMAAGLPVIGCFDASSGAAELLREAGCGLHVEPNDPAALADAVRTLADDPDLRHRLGEAGRAYVNAHGRRQTATQQYDECLRKTRASRK